MKYFRKMAEFENRLMNLFHYLINNYEKMDDSVWREIFSFSLRSDVESGTEFCFSFRKGNVNQ